MHVDEAQCLSLAVQPMESTAPECADRDAEPGAAVQRRSIHADVGLEGPAVPTSPPTGVAEESAVRPNLSALQAAALEQALR